MGKFALSMMGSVGELERNTIVENVKMGFKHRAKTGRHHSKPPLGYTNTIVDLGSAGAHKRKTFIKIIPEEAAIAKRIFEMFSTGHGYRSIANQLNHDGYKTKMNRPFSICSVKDNLDNPFYIGKVRYNRYENWSEKRCRGKRTEQILADGIHKAIIDERLLNETNFFHGNQKSSLI